MSRVVLMCGPSGSGKSTYAAGLEREGMVRLSYDTVLWERGLPSPVPEEHRAAVETVLERVRRRRGDHADDVVLDEEQAARHFDTFESPTEDEGPLTVVR